MPHGDLTLWAGVLGTFGFILSNAALGTCRYFIRTSTATNNTHGIGLYSWEQYDVASGYYLCYTTYAQTRGIDTAWTAARAMAGIAAVAGLFCMIMVWCAMCFVYPPKVWKLVALGYLLASATAISTLSFYASWACENGCKFSAGASCAVISFVLYALCAGVCFKMPPAKPEDDDLPVVAAAPGTITTTEIIKPDGTRIVEKVTVNADGSRTVERTTESPTDPATKA